MSRSCHLLTVTVTEIAVVTEMALVYTVVIETGFKTLMGVSVVSNWPHTTALWAVCIQGREFYFISAHIIPDCLALN